MTNLLLAFHVRERAPCLQENPVNQLVNNNGVSWIQASCIAAFSFFIAAPMAAQTGPVDVPLTDNLPRQHANAANDWSPQAGQAPGQGSPHSQNKELKKDERFANLFGEVTQLGHLPDSRASHAQSPAANAVFGAEAKGRETADLGDLLNQSKSTHGVSIQQRTPIVTETRVRGQRVGQVLASGSYWAPARMDLDTMMSKIDSRLIENAILVKGPYATRYGPGFRFVDLDFIHSPRSQNGPQLNGMTSANYHTNGAQWSGRQSLWGGGRNYGFHLSYGHRTGNDYETGFGTSLPSSYKSRDLFFAVGRDISPYESIEVNALRLDQTDVEFPGLVFDLNFLVTDGYELTYTNTNPMLGDRFTSEFWYNRTRFEGDTLRPGKNAQIPQLQLILPSFSGVDGIAITDGDALSAGYRFETTFLNFNCFGGQRETRIGTDLIFLNQELNDIEPEGALGDNNYPIPRSYSADVGMYIENVNQLSQRLTTTAGARIDGVFADAEDIVAGVATPISTLQSSDLRQDFLLGSAYLTGKYQLNSAWTLDVGGGFAMRPPTLSELYATSSFIGSLQRGLTFLEGDPQLNAEKLFQIDFGTHYETERLRYGAFGHYAWIHDYITYDLIAPAGGAAGLSQGAAFVNTDLATLAGFEAYGQYELNRMISLFGNISFLEGRDHSRNDPSRLSVNASRSGMVLDEEPLPGIAPLDSRIGLLFQDPSPNRCWGLEFSARVVDNQDRIAASLEEIATPGFTTFDIRGYRKIQQWLVTMGVENLGDRAYREHIDYRSGLGVFRPGFNYYVGTEVNY